VNPFAVLGLPEWPDLDDQTVRAAWNKIAADTSPARPDGGDLAKYAQASVAFAQLSTLQGRAQAYAGLAVAADACLDDGPGEDTAGSVGEEAWPGDELVAVMVFPVVVVPEPVPLREVARMIAEIPSRIGRGHPWRTLIRGAVLAGLALAVLATFPAVPRLAVAAVAATVFVMTGREDLAPRSHSENNPGKGKNQPEDKEINASGGASGSGMEQGPRTAFWP
jgi:hypothetical protein